MKSQTAHKIGCPQIISQENQYIFYASKDFNNSSFQNIKPCKSCMAKELVRYRREKNKKNLDSLPYNYIYVPGSAVFHEKSCHLFLSSKKLFGTEKYKTCIKKGLRPCKICHPDLPLRKDKQPPEKAVLFRSLSKEEQKAYDHFLLSGEQRKNICGMNFQTFRFLAGKGYDNFHLKSCSKIKGVKNLRGFSCYEDAIHAGYKPCRICHPTEKNNQKLTIPASNKIRPNESIQDIIVLCDSYQFPYQHINGDFELETPVGKWKIPKMQRPYHLYHINYIKTPNGNNYHQQPRLFLSLKDIFDYIVEHDNKLYQRIYFKKMPSPATEIQNNPA